MRREELKVVFDQMAAGYDKQWARMAPIRESLHFLLGSVFAGLPADARILCVGVGTGAELSYMARLFPGWRFTAVDPSGAMLNLCRERADAEGYRSRCDFHEGYLDTLTMEGLHDGATCFLVSQFMLEREARCGFYRLIADRLVAGGVVAICDLASDVRLGEYEALLRVWMRVMSTAGVEEEALERMRAAYAKDVAILPPGEVVGMIEASGFGRAVQFFQAGLMHGWFAGRGGERG